jgi:hypothetical protein
MDVDSERRDRRRSGASEWSRWKINTGEKKEGRVAGPACIDGGEKKEKRTVSARGNRL